MYQKLANEYAANPRDVATVPLNGQGQKWFHVFAEDDRLYVTSGKNHQVICEIKNPICLEERQAEAMLDIYHRRQRGEAVSAEAHKVTFQSAYWYGVFEDMGW